MDMMMWCLLGSPEEACGFIMVNEKGEDYCQSMTNEDHALGCYSMPGGELFQVWNRVRKEGHQFKSVFHSHPDGFDRPSGIDYSWHFSGPTGENFPGIPYIIVCSGNPGLTVKGFLFRMGEAETI